MTKRTEPEVSDCEYDDPIVAEIRRIRTEFSDRFNGDMEAMYRYFREGEGPHPERRYRREPLHRDPVEAEAGQEV